MCQKLKFEIGDLNWMGEAFGDLMNLSFWSWFLIIILNLYLLLLCMPTIYNCPTRVLKYGGGTTTARVHKKWPNFFKHSQLLYWGMYGNTIYTFNNRKIMEIHQHLFIVYIFFIWLNFLKTGTVRTHTHTQTPWLTLKINILTYM